MPIRAASGPIQVQPPGLLGLLQLKNLGRNPHSLDDLVVPTFDLGEWYLRADQFEASHVPCVPQATGAIGFVAIGFGTAALFEVPSSEWWYVHTAQLFSGSIPAGDQVIAAAAWREGGSASVAQMVSDPVAVAVSTVDQQLWVSARDFWVPPGAIFGVVLTRLETAAGLDFNMQVRATRTPI